MTPVTAPASAASAAERRARRPLRGVGLAVSAGWLGVVVFAPAGAAVSYLAIYALAACLALLVVGGKALAPLFRFSAAALGWGVGVGAVMTALTYGLYPIVRPLHQAVPEQVTHLYGQLAVGSVVVALPLVIIVIVGEELIWRGALLGAPEGPRALGRLELGRVALTSSVYALAQAGFGSVLLVVVAFGCGVVWAALRLHTGRLIAPLAAHLVWSACVLWLAPLEA